MSGFKQQAEKSIAMRELSAAELLWVAGGDGVSAASAPVNPSPAPTPSAMPTPEPTTGTGGG